MAYRISRNLEASIIDYIEEQLVIDNWSDINVVKTFARVSGLNLPAICIRCGETDHRKAQLGDDSTFRTASVLIDIFGINDGNRLDLKDWLIGAVKRGMPYYDYTVVGGEVTSKIPNGRIRVQDIIDTPINFDVDKNILQPPDRFRHLITIAVSIGKVEE